MMEFHAGNGPDTQAIGIALEEMFLDYRVMPGKAPLPVIVVAGGGRVVGSPNILIALGRKTSRFLPNPQDVAPWLASSAPDTAALEERLAASSFILGDISVADMAVYPRLAGERAILAAHPAIARWAARMAMRSATGRGMGVIGR